MSLHWKERKKNSTVKKKKKKKFQLSKFENQIGFFK